MSKTFQERSREWLDDKGFDTIMSVVDGLEGEAKLKWIKDIILPYGSSKYNSSEYNGKVARDIHITLELDPDSPTEAPDED